MNSKCQSSCLPQAGKYQINDKVQNRILKSKTLNLFQGKVQNDIPGHAEPGPEFNSGSKDFGISFDL